MSIENQLATLASHMARRQKELWASYDRDEISFDQLRHQLGDVLGEACASPLSVLAEAEAEEAAKPTAPRAAATGGLPRSTKAAPARTMEELAREVYAARRATPAS